MIFTLLKSQIESFTTFYTIKSVNIKFSITHNNNCTILFERWKEMSDTEKSKWEKLRN